MWEYVQRDPQVYIINTSGKSFVVEILGRLGIDSSRIVSLQMAPTVFVREAVLPETPQAYRPTTLDTVGVQGLLWTAFNLTGQPTDRGSAGQRGVGVWVSRKGETTRDVLNEMEVVEGLAAAFPDLDWEVFNPSVDDISPSEVVQRSATAFHRASMVVGVHGAALTNVYFMRPGTILVELLVGRPPEFACFGRLAAQMGIRLHYCCPRFSIAFQ